MGAVVSDESVRQEIGWAVRYLSYFHPDFWPGKRPSEEIVREADEMLATGSEEEVLINTEFSLRVLDVNGKVRLSVSAQEEKANPLLGLANEILGKSCKDWGFDSDEKEVLHSLLITIPSEN
ncbi:hypothetical protein HQ544_04415 [Candidatus Falkowbacteria bacterium]|nr:hypothetical protein [Candidatus Falkowbacteria bacterium]